MTKFESEINFKKLLMTSMDKEKIKKHFSKLGKKSWEVRKQKILKAPIKKMKELPECAETPNNL